MKDTKSFELFQLSFLVTRAQLRRRKTNVQADVITSPYQMLLDSMIPHPLSMISLIPCTASVCGTTLATILIHVSGIPSSGQKIPLSSNCGIQAPMASFMASAEVSQMVERKMPKLIPTNPWSSSR